MKRPAWLAACRAHLAKRLWWTGFFVALGMLYGGRHRAPVSQDEYGLKQLLSADGAGLQPSSIIWEPPGGFWQELLIGRRLAFQAHQPNQPNDIYRAWVWVSPEGRIGGVREIVNLTRTPLGDEIGLIGSGDRAAYATSSYGRIQAVTWLDLAGIAAEYQPPHAFDQLLLSVSSLQATGSFAGIGRTDVIFDHELPAAPKLERDGQLLALTVGEPPVRVDRESLQRNLGSAEARLPPGVRVQTHHYRRKPLIHWAVDTARNAIGPLPIAWLEDKFFAAHDAVKRTLFGLLRRFEDTAPPAMPRIVRQINDPANDGWPPAPIDSIFSDGKPGEGRWLAVEFPWLPRSRAWSGSPAYFYRTFLRPDVERPYARLLLIAMDTRQLELGMVAGYEDPAPLTGPPGDGRLPETTSERRSIAATFNGAFKTTHGAYGMMVDQRVLVPPADRAATIAVTTEGRIAFGNWPPTGGLDTELSSFRQNLDALVDDGAANPSGRRVWGWHRIGESVLTERSALCVNNHGHVYYAWGRELTGNTLARGLVQAGCVYAVHLDMNPQHCGFVFTGLEQPDNPSLELADAAMQIREEKYIEGSAKDFFFIRVREPLSAMRDDLYSAGSAGAESPWARADRQPPPAFLPAVFTRSIPISGHRVDVFGFARDRIEARFVASVREPGLNAEPAADAPWRELLAAIDVGHAPLAHRAGLASFGQWRIAPEPSRATLVLAPGQTPRVHLPGELPELEPAAQAVQLPLIAARARLLEVDVDRPGLRPRAGLCIAASGELYLARTEADSHRVIAEALLSLGCTEAVGLDRGAGSEAAIELIEPVIPSSALESSRLLFFGRAAHPTAFQWRSQSGAPRAEAPHEAKNRSVF